MEQAVAQRVRLEPRDGGDRLDLGDHVVPLEDLVYHDAVEEAAQAEPEQHRAPYHLLATDVFPHSSLRIVVFNRLSIGY